MSEDTTLLWIALLTFHPVANTANHRMDACHVRARTQEEAIAQIRARKQWDIPDWTAKTQVSIVYVKSFAEFVATRAVGFDRQAWVAPTAPQVVVAEAPVRRRR